MEFFGAYVALWDLTIDPLENFSPKSILDAEARSHLTPHNLICKTVKIL